MTRRIAALYFWFALLAVRTQAEFCNSTETDLTTYLGGTKPGNTVAVGGAVYYSLPVNASDAQKVINIQIVQIGSAPDPALTIVAAWSKCPNGSNIQYSVNTSSNLQGGTGAAMLLSTTSLSTDDVLVIGAQCPAGCSFWLLPSKLEMPLELTYNNGLTGTLVLDTNNYATVYVDVPITETALDLQIVQTAATNVLYTSPLNPDQQDDPNPFLSPRNISSDSCSTYVPGRWIFTLTPNSSLTNVNLYAYTRSNANEQYGAYRTSIQKSGIIEPDKPIFISFPVNSNISVISVDLTEITSYGLTLTANIDSSACTSIAAYENIITGDGVHYSVDFLVQSGGHHMITFIITGQSVANYSWILTVTDYAYLEDIPLTGTSRQGYNAGYTNDTMIYYSIQLTNTSEVTVYGNSAQVYGKNGALPTSSLYDFHSSYNASLTSCAFFPGIWYFGYLTPVAIDDTYYFVAGVSQTNNTSTTGVLQTGISSVIQITSSPLYFTWPLEPVPNNVSYLHVEVVTSSGFGFNSIVSIDGSTIPCNTSYKWHATSGPSGSHMTLNYFSNGNQYYTLSGNGDSGATVTAVNVTNDANGSFRLRHGITETVYQSSQQYFMYFTLNATGPFTISLTGNSFIAYLKKGSLPTPTSFDVLGNNDAGTTNITINRCSYYGDVGGNWYLGLLSNGRGEAGSVTAILNGVQAACNRSISFTFNVSDAAEGSQVNDTWLYADNQLGIFYQLSKITWYGTDDNLYGLQTCYRPIDEITGKFNGTEICNPFAGCMGDGNFMCAGHTLDIMSAVDLASDDWIYSIRAKRTDLAPVMYAVSGETVPPDDSELFPDFLFDTPPGAQIVGFITKGGYNQEISSLQAIYRTVSCVNGVRSSAVHCNCNPGWYGVYCHIPSGNNTYLGYHQQYYNKAVDTAVDPENPYTSQANWFVLTVAGGYNQTNAFLRFDTSNIPHNANVVNATLRINYVQLLRKRYDTANAYFYDVLDDNWSDNITFATRPASETQPFQFIPFIASPDTFIYFDMTSKMSSNVQQNKIFNIMLGSDINSYSFSSSESDFPPMLFVSYQLPEPASTTGVMTTTTGQLVTTNAQGSTGTTGSTTGQSASTTASVGTTNLVATTDQITPTSTSDASTSGQPATDGKTEQDNTVGIAVGVSLGLAALLVLSLGFFIYRRRKRQPQQINNLKDSRAIEMQNTNSITPEEIGSTSQFRQLTGIEIQHKLGGGNFGEVYSGLWKKNTKVALKKLKSVEIEEFQKEARTLASMDHPNVVHFYGLYAHNGESYIVTELVAKGCAIDVIRQEELTDQDLYFVARDTAAGMQHLEEKGIVHADLALRNVLLAIRPDGDAKYIAKVSDFGLSKKLYGEAYYKSESNSTLPVRWTAPEALKYGKFSHASDVYAYGMLLYELFTKGCMPFVGKTNSEVVDLVLEGERPKYSKSIPDEVFNLMQKCWAELPGDRPSFELLYEFFDKIIKATTIQYVNIKPDSSDQPAHYQLSQHFPSV